MHSFLQRKLKNLHGEARVWGSSTPRPPPLIVQPKGRLSSAAGSGVHGARVPGGQGAGALVRSAAGAAAGLGGRRQCRSAGGSPEWGGGGAGDGRLGHTPVSSSVILWDFPKEAAGLREGGRVSERATRGDVTVAPWPFQGPAPGGTRTGSRVGPGPLGLAVSLGRPPASLPQQRRAAGRREGLRGARPS